MRRYLLMLSAVFTCSIAYSQTAEEYYQQGLSLKKELKTAEAINAFRQATSLKENYTAALYEMGWCYNDQKNYSEALQVLKPLRGEWYNIPKLHFEIGYAFDKLAMTDSAIASYNKCLQYKPDYSAVFKQMGDINYNKSDNEKAIENYRKYELYAKAPITDYLFWFRKGYTFNALKQYDSAKAALAKSMNLNSNYITTYYELGFACTKLKQNDDAINWFKKGMEKDPKSHIPYNGIAEVYRDNIKDRNEAMNWYRQALAINANERKANYGMGYCLNSIGKYSEAMPYLIKAIENETGYVAAYAELGYSYYKLGNYTMAIDNLNKSISFSPKAVNARYYLCLVYIAQNNKSMAQKMVDEMKPLNQDNAKELQEKVDRM